MAAFIENTPDIDQELSTADRILQVATLSFARNGYHGTSILDIAGAVNLSVATLFYYVQNKDDLYPRVRL